MSKSRVATPTSRSSRAFLVIAAALTAATALPVTWLALNEPGPLALSRVEARKHVIEKLKTKKAKPFDQPSEALDFYWAKRSPTGEPMSRSPLEDAAEAAAAMPLHTTLAGRAGHVTSAPLGGASSAVGVSGTIGAWQAHGPGNIGGRSRALLIHRTQNNLMWTAGVAGGIWKS